MRRLQFHLALVVCAFCATAVGADDANRWEGAIARFEEQDAKSPPPKGAILFLGSSSIRFWDEEASFPDLTTINRGFGGSQIADSLHFVSRIVTPYAPKTIVFYAGDNDIAGGKKAEEVLSDYQALVKRVRSDLPDVHFVYVAIKPSLARWSMVEEMRAANRKIEEFSKDDPKLEFADIDTPMLGDDGKPRAELFIQDGLHLSRAGYALWTSILRPYITNTIK